MCARLLARKPGGLRLDRLARADGPHQEGDEPKPMMHEREKSDPAMNHGEADDRGRATGRGDGGAKGGAEENADEGGTLRAWKARPTAWTAYGKPRG
jgi:hypothetical protein